MTIPFFSILKVGKKNEGQTAYIPELRYRQISLVSLHENPFPTRNTNRTERQANLPGSWRASPSQVLSLRAWDKSPFRLSSNNSAYHTPTRRAQARLKKALNPRTARSAHLIREMKTEDFATSLPPTKRNTEQPPQQLDRNIKIRTFTRFLFLDDITDFGAQEKRGRGILTSSGLLPSTTNPAPKR